MTRILVVDDIENNIKTLSFDLLDDNYEVTTALSGHQALLEINNNPPDLILLDLLMPEMDGFEVCRRLQETPQHREIPIIVVSALDDNESIVRALDIGAQDYVTKPYYYPIIAARVRAALRQKRERDLLIQLNSDLDQARTMAEAGMRAKSSFLTNMSHEVRTPINGITGMAHLLRDSELDDEQREYVDTIELVSDNLLNIIDEILDYSKIEAGEVFIEHKRFHLRDSVDQAIDSISELARQKAVAVEVSVDPDLPVSFLGDSGRVRQILHHLLHNAVKFTQSGAQQKVSLQVSPSARAPKNDQYAQVRVQIADTGIGFNPDLLQTLLGSFSQADETTQRRYGGTGLGLAICYQLVDHMDGNIELNSQPNQGTQIELHLPFEKDFSDSPITPGWHALKDSPVLVLTDADSNATQLQQCLDVFGCQIKTEALTPPFEQSLNGVLNRDHSPRFLVIQAQAEHLTEIVSAVEQVGKLNDCPYFVVEPWPPSALGIYDGKRLQQPMQHGAWYQTIQETLADTTAETIAEHTHRPPILLAEDNIVNQKVALKILDNLGYQVDAVNNGVDAVDAIKRKTYGLVLMDCQMPEMDGYQATQEIRKMQGLERHLPIIALTAHAMRGDRERCLESGMDDYLTKPIKIPQLKDTLEHWFKTLED